MAGDKMKTYKGLFIILFTYVSCASASGTPEFENEEISQADEDVNVFTDKVRAFCALLAPDVEIKTLEKPFADIKKFIENKVKNDSNFKDKLNDEGMVPRIIEQELELRLRHTLAAKAKELYGKHWADCLQSAGRKGERGDLKENAKVELCFQNEIYKDKDLNLIQKITNEEMNSYILIENRNGPVIRFKNLNKRYPDYAPFIEENKRYTEQEAHLLIHLATYYNGIEEALRFAQQNPSKGVNYLLYLLDTYLEWLPSNTHTSTEVGELIAHGSIFSATDKQGRTVLNLTEELKNKAENLFQRNKPLFNIVKSKLDQITDIFNGVGKVREYSGGVESKYIKPETYNFSHQIQTID